MKFNQSSFFVDWNNQRLNRLKEHTIYSRGRFEARPWLLSLVKG